MDFTYWKKDTPSEDTTRTAKSGVQLQLDPETTYQADLYGTQIEPAARPEPPEISVAGEATPSGGYQYTYSLEENDLDSWTDPFGNSHTGDEVTVQAQDALKRHRITLNWPTDAQDLTIETEWNLPDEEVPVEVDVATGHRIPAELIPIPEFTAQQFSGSREVTLQSDVYRPGEWQLSPVGYLPPSMEGTLEEYVDTVYLGPGGEEIGTKADIERPTKLSIKLTVKASGGDSPIVYGAVRWRE